MGFSLLLGDSTLPGFGIYLTSTGTTVFAVQFMKRGRPVTEVIGRAGKISPGEAWKKAVKVLSANASPATKEPSPALGRKGPAQGNALVTDANRVSASEVHAQASPPERKRPRLLFFDEMQAIVRYSRSQIDRLEAKGTFPKRVAIGTGRVGWIESEIDEYLAKRIAARSMKVGTLGSAGQTIARGKWLRPK